MISHKIMLPKIKNGINHGRNSQTKEQLFLNVDEGEQMLIYAFSNKGFGERQSNHDNSSKEKYGKHTLKINDKL